jgi:hypothetical protein
MCICKRSNNEIVRELTKGNIAMRRKRLLFLLFLLGIFPGIHGSANAQCSSTQGSPVVYGGCGGPTASSAYIDASVFSGNDICAKINTVLTTAYPSPGTVVDARGILPTSGGSEQCQTNPFINVNVPSIVLLPLTNIQIKTTWVLPSGTQLLGGGTPPSGRTSGSRATLQILSAGSFSGTSMIQMCATGNTCTGVIVKHLTLDAIDAASVQNQTVNGIYNAGAGPASLVDDVNLDNIPLTGILVGTGGAQSGPYTNINFSAANLSNYCGGSGPCPGCVTLQAQTLGVDGITCIGAPVTSGAGGTISGADPAAISVQMGGNTVRNGHVEAFWDGVQIGSTANVVKDVLVSNLTSATKGGQYGPVTNTVHICGLAVYSTSRACFTSNPEAVADVSVFQIANNGSSGTGVNTKQILRDDVANISVTTATNLNAQYEPLGMYVLGNPEPVGSGQANSVFSTASSAAHNTTTSNAGIPTWVVGSGDASGPCSVATGSVYSNINGTEADKNTIYVCSGGAWQPVI